MLVITFSQSVQVTVAKSVVACNAGERFLWDTSVAQSFVKEPVIYEMSDAAPYFQPKPPTELRGRRVLFYRRGGAGDQLIASGAVRYFVEVLGANTYVACEKARLECWLCNPSITGLPLSKPVHLDVCYRGPKGQPFFYDCRFLESVYEGDSDPEQPNCYDRLFTSLGVDPDTVDPKYKRPQYQCAQNEIEARDAWMKSKGIGDYIVIQLLSADTSQSLPLPVIEKVMEAGNEVALRHGLKLLVTHDSEFNPEITDIIAKTPTAENVAGKTAFRAFAALIQGSKCFVGPDSAGLHLCAALGAPALGIWGTHDPMCRAKYYEHQIHLWHPEMCQNSPCFNVLPNALPIHKCPRGAEQKTCECFEKIDQQEISDALEELLR